MKFGMIPSPPDERDYTLAKAISYSASPIVERMVSYIPEPVNQGEFGVCAAVTLAGVLEAVEYKQRGVRIPISIKYLYGNRADRDYQGEGMMPRELLQMATKFGAVRDYLLTGLSDYPTAKASITPALDGEGIPNRPFGYVRLRTIQEVNDYMAKYDLPIFFGAYVTNSFVNNVPSSGVVPPAYGNILGGHAMVCAGIRNISNKWYLVLQNSWGTAWGQKGRGYINPDEHQGVEMWGIIPEATDLLVNRPQTIYMTIGKTDYYVDNVKKTMDVAPFIQNDRTFVPLRFMAEALGAKVTPVKYPNGSVAVILQWGGEEE